MFDTYVCFLNPCFTNPCLLRCPIYSRDFLLGVIINHLFCLCHLWVISFFFFSSFSRAMISELQNCSMMCHMIRLGREYIYLFGLLLHIWYVISMVCYYAGSRCNSFLHRILIRRRPNLHRVKWHIVS
jgi:hypothetical protein